MCKYIRTTYIYSYFCRKKKVIVLTDKNLCAMMDKAMYSERPTDYVLWRTWREEVSETSLRRNLKNLDLRVENLSASHKRKS